MNSEYPGKQLVHLFNCEMSDRRSEWEKDGKVDCEAYNRIAREIILRGIYQIPYEEAS